MFIIDVGDNENQVWRKVRVRALMELKLLGQPKQKNDSFFNTNRNNAKCKLK